MILSDRINCFSNLGNYMLGNDRQWQEIKKTASVKNGWFIPPFIDIAAEGIAKYYLRKDILEKWTSSYSIPPENPSPKTVGIVMAGNIPMVGFHDLLCVLITGNKAAIKLSSKDETLMKHITDMLEQFSPLISFPPMLKDCDAYIATGSNNTSRYFDYYFGKYPHIIRRNKTSVAVLSGSESNDELEKLADDVFLFFGLGCRNVTKIYVPESYDFVPLLAAFKKYDHLADHHKYKNNYDYNLTLHILNKKFYMTNGAILLAEDAPLFSPISQLNYSYYKDREKVVSSLHDNPDLQCIVGDGFVPFGKAQQPAINDYADRVDTMAFLRGNF